MNDTIKAIASKVALALMASFLSGVSTWWHQEVEKNEIVSASRYVTQSMAIQMQTHADSRCMALNEFASQLFDDLYKLEGK